MCDPLTIAGVSLSALGTMKQQQDQQKNIARGIEARNDATASNFARQDAMQQRADSEFGDVLKRFDPNQQRRDEARAKTARQALATSSVTQPGSYQVSGGNAPAVVKSEIDRVQGDTTAKSQAGAQRAGAVAALGDPRFNNALALDSSRGKLATTSDFARGIANLLPLEQSAATTNAYKAPGPLGPLMQLGGQAATLAGVSGVGPKWGDLFGAPSTMTMPHNFAGTPSVFALS